MHNVGIEEAGLAPVPRFFWYLCWFMLSINTFCVSISWFNKNSKSEPNLILSGELGDLNSAFSEVLVAIVLLNNKYYDLILLLKFICLNTFVTFLFVLVCIYCCCTARLLYRLTGNIYVWLWYIYSCCSKFIKVACAWWSWWFLFIRSWAGDLWLN